MTGFDCGLVETKATIHGPFVWSKSESCVFNQPEVLKRGIYLWTIPWKGKYLTNYVGMVYSQQGFKRRLKEHMRSYQNGLYRIYDSKEFSQGNVRIIWEGLWLPERKAHKEEYKKEFDSDYESKYKDRIEALLKVFKLFLVPIEMPDNYTRTTFQKFIRRIEDAMVFDMILKSNDVYELYDDTDIKMHKLRKNYQIKINLKNNEQIIGLSNEILC